MLGALGLILDLVIDGELGVPFHVESDASGRLTGYWIRLDLHGSSLFGFLDSCDSVQMISDHDVVVGKQSLRFEVQGGHGIGHEFPFIGVSL